LPSLATTRADDELRIYDPTSAATLRLALPTRDSKTVAFSPDGALLAALTSDGRLHVWRFDAREGRAELLVGVFAVPTARRATTAPGNTRQAQWIDWVDATHLAVATGPGPPGSRRWRLRMPPPRHSNAAARWHLSLNRFGCRSD
jgi:hypothetical protein